MTPAQWLARQIETDDPDLLRSTVKTMAEALMSAQADNLCGAAYGQRSDERTNSRNGYRSREWDIRAGTIELAIPKLRSIEARLVNHGSGTTCAMGQSCSSSDGTV